MAFEPTESGAARNMKKSPAKTNNSRRPSKASLAEIPEIDFSKVRMRKNPYASRLAKEGFVVQVGRGQPRKVEDVDGPRTHSGTVCRTAHKRRG